MIKNKLSFFFPDAMIGLFVGTDVNLQIADDQDFVTIEEVTIQIPEGEDLYDAIDTYLHHRCEWIDEISFKWVTEYIHKENEETYEIYIAFDERQIEVNEAVTNAIRNYFDTNEAFTVYGPCIVFAVIDGDSEADFKGSDFNTLFYGF